MAKCYSYTGIRTPISRVTPHTVYPSPPSLYKGRPLHLYQCNVRYKLLNNTVDKVIPLFHFVPIQSTILTQWTNGRVTLLFTTTTIYK